MAIPDHRKLLALQAGQDVGKKVGKAATKKLAAYALTDAGEKAFGLAALFSK